MYLHLGNDYIVKTQTVVGIFDLETSTINKHTRKMLSVFQKKGDVINVTDEMPKTFILCKEENGREKIYVSNISSATLLKRLELLPIPGAVRKEWI